MAASMELIKLFAAWKIHNPQGTGTAEEFYDWLEALKTELDAVDGARSTLDGVTDTGAL